MSGLVETDISTLDAFHAAGTPQQQKERMQKEKEYEKDIARAEKQRKAALKKAREEHQVIGAKKAQKAMKREEAPVTKKKKTNRLLTIAKINQYYDRLKHKIRMKKPSITARTTDEQVEEILEAVEKDLGFGQGVGQAGALYVAGLGMLEQLSVIFPLGIKLAGPTASLAQTAVSNKQLWEDTVTEFAIKHSDWFCVGPEKRLLMLTAQLCLSVHDANTSVPMEVKVKTEASTDLKSKAKDL